MVHSNARVSITKGREEWKAFYDIKDGRATGELWENGTKKRDFNVKLVGGYFRTDAGSGTRTKLAFKH